VRTCTAPALSCSLLLLAVVGCGGGEAPEPAVPAVPEVERVAVDAATTGTIKGVVRVNGDFPSPRRVSFGSEAACSAAHDGPVYFDTALATGGKLQNAFVWVKQGLEGYAFPTPTAEVVVDQRGCIYQPHVVGVQVGQPLTFVNSDATTHNVRTVPKKGHGTNFSMPREGMRSTRTYKRPQVMMQTKCDIHPWMSAWIGVIPHPAFAISAADGRFEITGVPPGDLVLEVWHEKLGSQTQSVSLVAKGEVSVEFSFEMPD
jgi:plastocyanin